MNKGIQTDDASYVRELEQQVVDQEKNMAKREKVIQKSHEREIKKQKELQKKL